MKRYNQIRIDERGHWAGSYVNDQGSEVRFQARPDLHLIHLAWAGGCDFEDLADGFGEGLGTAGGDWSGIRDSSDPAIERMLARALTYLEALSQVVVHEQTQDIRERMAGRRRRAGR